MKASNSNLTISTVVHNASPTRFDMTGRSLGRDLHVSSESIKPGLVDRLVRYAINKLQEGGFPVFQNVQVSTTKDEGYYTVKFINDKGGYIGLTGILIGRGGHPHLHYSFIADIDSKNIK